MFTEILKIVPRLDTKDLNAMEKTLSTRFKRVANGFAKGIRVGLLSSLGGAVLQKLLSPLNEVREAIDRTLKQADDVATNAEQFGTTTEKLLRLRALGGLKGLQPEQLDILLNKFQTAVAQAEAKPGDPGSEVVSNFIGRKDTADAFFEFVQSLQKLDKPEQLRVQEQVFGEKQILKMSEFLQSDFSQSIKELGSVDFGKVAGAVTKLEGLESMDARNRTVRGLNDLVSKSKVINSGTVGSVNETELNNLRRENERIANIQQAARVEEQINKIGESLEKLVNTALTELPIIMQSLNAVVDLLKMAVDGWKQIFDLLKKAPFFRGITGLFGQGKDK